jgi:peptide/nickel transport system permease protein
VLTYVARRLLTAIPIVLIASFLLFWFVRDTFDPTAHLRSSKDPNAVVRERARLDLDEPITVQYGNWLEKFVQGDWGRSERTREDVSAMIGRALWNTGQLMFWSLLVAAALAISIGVYSAVRQYSLLDYTFTGLSFVGLAVPTFVLGLVAIQVLGIDLPRWLGLGDPLFFFVGLHSGDGGGLDLDYLQHLMLPVLTISVGIVASWSRYQRASMLDVLSADYVRTARAKGVPRRRVLFRHALRNALIPVVTVIALDIGVLIGELIVTEQIFSVPGMGRLFLSSLQRGDAAVLVVWTVITAIFIVVFNLIADVVYTILDPRIRLT